jgi:hypothetical protein
MIKLFGALLLLTLAPLAWPQGGAPAKIEQAEKPRSEAAAGTHALPAHGTVNVFLANKNGLVAVTDSMLSSNQGIVGYSQKLFKVDDRTICSIAGWYSDPGPAIRPDVASAPSYPAYLAVPQIMQGTISRVGDASGNLERKMRLLAGAFKISLLVVSYIDEIDGVTPTASTSQITVAGFDEKGTLEILRTDLVPILQNEKPVGYLEKKYQTVYVTQTTGLVPVFRGIDGTAQSILDGSYPSMASDPILGNFMSALARDKGKSLSLLDLEQVAKQIERRTSQQFPSKVGGKLQIAELSEGKVAKFDQPNSSLFHLPAIAFWADKGVGVSDSAWGLSFPSHTLVAFVLQANFSGVGSQPLDNIFFFETKFAHCKFTYQGSPRSIFDRSNTVVDSTLTLLPGADPNSNFVKQIKVDFPALAIIDKTKVSPSIGDRGERVTPPR